MRIQAPIPGKRTVGVEVANETIQPVGFREVLEKAPLNKANSKLLVALGKNIMGETKFAEIDKTPHMLVAGATGSGKSVCINCIIASILMRTKPDEVKLVMVDPKKVELSNYNGVPHLLMPVVTDPKKAAGALNWAVQEMVNRYNLFAEKGVRDLAGYNKALEKKIGARGLNKIITDSTWVAYDEVASHPGVYEEIILDSDTVENEVSKKKFIENDPKYRNREKIDLFNRLTDGGFTREQDELSGRYKYSPIEM